VQVATIEMTLRYSHLSPEVGRSGVAARSAWQFHGNGHQPVGQLAERREKNWWRRRESNADLTPRRVSWNRMESCRLADLDSRRADSSARYPRKAVPTCTKRLCVSQAGQLAMREVLGAHLRRPDFEPQGLAQRLYPFTRAGAHGGLEVDDPRFVVFDPGIAFGRLVIAGTGMPR